MKTAVTILLAVLFVAQIHAEDAAAAAEDDGAIKTYKRLIPADVLRGKGALS